MSWRAARSITTLQAELTAAYPSRTRPDWLIGDAAHAGSASDHNPNAAGVVCAIDIRQGGGINLNTVAETIKRNNPAAVKYVIFNRRIWSKARNSEGWRTYSGSNPHSDHVHVSVGVGSDGRSTGPYDSTGPWGISSGGTTPTPPPSRPGTTAPKFPLAAGHWYGPESSNPRNHSGYYTSARPGIRQIRDRLIERGWRGVARGDRYDVALANVIRQFQREKRIAADGLVGAQTWPVLWTAPIT